MEEMRALVGSTPHDDCKVATAMARSRRFGEHRSAGRPSRGDSTSGDGTVPRRSGLGCVVGTEEIRALVENGVTGRITPGEYRKAAKTRRLVCFDFDK